MKDDKSLSVCRSEILISLQTVWVPYCNLNELNVDFLCSKVIFFLFS